MVCDAGVHPAYNGMASLPFVDELDWSTVDALLITQYAPLLQLPYFHAELTSESFHLDHAASVTYITEKVHAHERTDEDNSTLVRRPIFGMGQERST